jgi:hypothetical protein
MMIVTIQVLADIRCLKQFFYDQNGSIVVHKRGELTGSEVARFIEEALAQE